MNLLQVGAAARRSRHDYPLVPHRLHLTARALLGLTVCLGPECTGPAGDILLPFGAVQAGGDGQVRLLRAGRATHCTAATTAASGC